MYSEHQEELEESQEGYALENSIRIFMAIVAILVVFGITMVFSASYIYSKEMHGESSYYLIKQLIYLGASLVVAFIVSRTKPTFWIKYSSLLTILISGALVLTFIPGLGVEVKGAHRWIDLGPASFQPGELVKFSSLLHGIALFENWINLTNKERIKSSLLALTPLLLLLNQPDFGSFSIAFIVLAFTCFMSRFPRKYFYSGLGIGLVLGGLALVSQPYRVQRMLTFLDPWKNPLGSGFQIIQSYLGFANGGVLGLGLGNSNEKLFYLPEAHNDFIFSVIGEELGFVGVVALALLYLGFLLFGFRIALNLKERLSALVVSSVVFTIAINAVLNMSVVLGLLPTKGLNLPFISSGGSSLLSNFFGLGILYSVIRYYQKKSNDISHSPDQFNSSAGVERPFNREQKFSW